MNDECLVQMHLVGCLAYNRFVGPHVFITYPNVHNDPNLTMTMIQLGPTAPPCSIHSTGQYCKREQELDRVWLSEYVGGARIV